MIYHSIENLPNGLYIVGSGPSDSDVYLEVSDEGYYIEGEELTDEDLWNIERLEEENVVWYKKVD